MDDPLPARPLIAVFGLGYVGCVTAAGLASLGHRVIGVDHDPKKVAAVQAGEAPFYEPGLGPLILAEIRSGRLTVASHAHEALQSADIAMVCVGTPARPDGSLDSSQIDAVAAQISAAIQGRGKPLILAVRSTVLPGLCESLVQPHFPSSSPVSFVSNPEFLREGHAVDDFFHPTLIVAGGEDAAAVRAVAALYQPLGVEPLLTRLRISEMIKYASNALKAVKIDFANEIDAICASLGIPAGQVMQTVHREQQRSRSAYLAPGFAFGGSCLTKDLRALICQARQRSIDLPLLESVLPSNERHLERGLHRILSHGAVRLGVFGLAFKAATGDVRDSPAVHLIKRLLAAGRSVRVFDPWAVLQKLSESHIEWLQAAIPSIETLSVRSLRELLDWSEQIILVHRPVAEMLDEILSSGLPVSALYAGNAE